MWVNCSLWGSLICLIQSSALSHGGTGLLQNSVDPLPTPVPATSAQPTWPSSTPLLPRQVPLGLFSRQRKYLKKGFKKLPQGLKGLGSIDVVSSGRAHPICPMYSLHFGRGVDEEREEQGPLKGRAQGGVPIMQSVVGMRLCGISDILRLFWKQYAGQRGRGWVGRHKDQGAIIIVKWTSFGEMAIKVGRNGWTQEILRCDVEAVEPNDQLNPKVGGRSWKPGWIWTLYVVRPVNGNIVLI